MYLSILWSNFPTKITQPLLTLKASNSIWADLRLNNYWQPPFFSVTPQIWQKIFVILTYSLKVDTTIRRMSMRNQLKKWRKVDKQHITGLFICTVDYLFIYITRFKTSEDIIGFIKNVLINQSFYANSIWKKKKIKNLWSKFNKSIAYD